jgi:acyl dehydratase
VSATTSPRVYGPATYEVGREKLREYTAVLGERHPLCHDRDAARAAGMRDLVAPPMFAAVYAFAPIVEAIVELVGEHLARMLHAEQRFVWHEPVCSGDVITTTAALESREDRNDKTLLVLRTISQNQLGQMTAEGWWTELIRGGLPA